MASGMPVNEACVTSFNDLKLRHSCKWIVFKIENDEIVVEKKGTGDASEFKKELPSSDCRYAVYDEGKSLLANFLSCSGVVAGCAYAMPSLPAEFLSQVQRI